MLLYVYIYVLYRRVSPLEAVQRDVELNTTLVISEVCRISCCEISAALYLFLNSGAMNFYTLRPASASAH